MPGECGGVLPPFPEHGLDVVNRRAGDRGLAVVPRGPGTVLLAERLRLRVTDIQAEARDALRERLQDTDLDALSPREALDLLYELKREANS